MKNKIIKKFLGLILIVSIFFTTITSVNAKVLSVEEIIAQMKKTEIYEGLLKQEIEVTSKIENNKINFYNNDEKILTLNIGKDYLEYDNRNFKEFFPETEEDLLKYFVTYFTLVAVIDSIFQLSGYTDYGISEEYDYKNNYEEYGILMEEEEYESNDGSTSTEMTYLKISTDTEKIVKLMTEYGEKIEEETSELIASLVPDIEVKNITENSATIYMDIPNYSYEDIDENVLCHVYRADIKDGLYKEIGKGLNCLDSVGMVDKDLESGKTYYYKAKVDGANNYSKVIEVNTKISSSTVVEESDKIEENPKTGKIYSVAILVIILLLNVATIVRVRKTYF